MLTYCTEIPEVYELADRVVVVDAGRAGAPMDVRAFADLTTLADAIASFEHTAVLAEDLTRSAWPPTRRWRGPMTGDGGWRIGVDTGGTFTDLVAVSPAGEVRLRKVSSTPSQPSAAVFAALERTDLDLEQSVGYFVAGHDDRDERGPPARRRPDASSSRPQASRTSSISSASTARACTTSSG